MGKRAGGDRPAASWLSGVERLIALTDSRAVGASLAVHPDDDMFEFSRAMTGWPALGAMAYFRAGLSIVSSFDSIVTWRFGGFERVGSVLDFAAGFGRSTRFLARRVAPPAITVAEIQPAALDFQAREFGVRPMLSTTDPSSLDAPDTYDLVLVSSLFTHLPGAMFGPWLDRMWRFVAPGGLLVFSVHDTALNPPRVPLVDGFAYEPLSEVAALDGAEYGTNVTTPAFVRRELSRALSPGLAAAALRLPGGLCHKQDLWVVADGPPAREQLSFEVGPSGAVDEFARSRDGGWWLRGWAADPGDATEVVRSHRIVEVSVDVDGERVATTTPRHDRPDIVRHFGRFDDPLISGAGWEVTVPGRAPSPDRQLAVVATCSHGKRFVLDSTRVGDLEVRSTTAVWARRAASARLVAATEGPAAVARRAAGTVARLAHLT